MKNITNIASLIVVVILVYFLFFKKEKKKEPKTKSKEKPKNTGVVGVIKEKETGGGSSVASSSSPGSFGIKPKPRGTGIVKVKIPSNLDTKEQYPTMPIIDNPDLKPPTTHAVNELHFHPPALPIKPFFIKPLPPKKPIQVRYHLDVKRPIDREYIR